jgi:hypothetical protein
MTLLAAIYLAICVLCAALANVTLLFEGRGDRFVVLLGAGLLIGGLVAGVALAVAL